MNEEKSTITIEYDKHRGIYLKFYETDIVQDCVIEKFMDENNLGIGDELVFKREVEPIKQIKKIVESL